MSQLTQRGIRDTFIRLLNQKPLDRISVTELVRECGISRKTFYNHFRSLDDLVERALAEETERALARKTSARYWLDIFLESASFLLGNEVAFLHLYRSHLHTFVKRYLYRLCVRALETYVRALAPQGAYRQQDMDVLVTFYANGISGIVSDWVRDAMTTDIARTLRDTGRLLQGSLIAALLQAARTTHLPESVQ